MAPPPAGPRRTQGGEPGARSAPTRGVWPGPLASERPARWGGQKVRVPDRLTREPARRAAGGGGGRQRRARGMDSAAAAFALDPPAPGPGPPPAPGDCAQARKNFSVSHLLDLEEVAAAGRRAAGPVPGPEAREGAAREPSGGSSGSEAAPQDGECAAWEPGRGGGTPAAGLGVEKSLP